jgi:cobalt-zinc-cadmium resistance protein CzcA
MASRLVEWALRNRFLVIAASILLIAVGVESMLRLPIDAVPDVTNVQVQVLTKAPALAPLEVERLITFPVESAMAGLPKLAEVRSVSKFGLSVVTVVFEDGTDIYRARQLVQERLAEAREAIPPGYGEPEMGPIATGLGEIFQFEVRGEPACPSGVMEQEGCWSPMQLRTVLDWFVAYQLKSVPGVVEVNTFGGLAKTYEVQPDPAALKAHDVTLADLFEALERNNRNVGGAYLVQHREQVVVRGEALLSGVEEIGDVVLRTTEEGLPVLVRHVGRVTLAPMVRQGVVTRDGQGEVVTGIVMMLMGENSRVVVDRVKTKIAEIEKSLPEGVRIVPFYDRTDLVRRTIGTVEKNLLEGAALVVAVLLLMLGSVAGGIVVAITIPVSMLFAFIGMNLVGVSGNLMSLGAIDFGLIVDGAVVIVENLFRVMGDGGPPGESRVERVRRAASEVARPVVFAVAIILIVYLPILTLTGVEGKMFRPMAITVAFALAGSLLLALTLVPVAASLLVRRTPRHHETFVVRAIRRAYEPVLSLAMRHRGITVGAAAAVLVAGGVVSTFMGAEFIPRLDEGAIAIQAWRLPSISVDEAAKQSSLLERVLLRDFPQEVETVVSKTGRAEIATDPMGVEMSDVFVMLRPPESWRFESKGELIEEMERSIRRSVPGLAVGFSQPIELRVSELIAGVRSDVAIKVFGEDMDEMRRTAETIARVVGRLPGADDVKVEQVSGLPILTIRPDRLAAARYGLDAAPVLDAIETLGGREVGVIVEGEKRFPLRVRFPEGVRNDPKSVAALPVAAPGGRMVALGQVASFDTESGAAQVSRERIHRRVTVEMNVRGRDLVSFIDEARAAIDRDVRLPPGVVLEWGGQFQNYERARGRLAVVVPLAMLLIFVLLYGAFGAARPALLIYTNVPFAAVGGIFALALRGLPFTISAGVGFIALFGVAVMNGVVLVSYIRKVEAEKGLAPVEAAIEAARVRMRPVLITALVASLGFVPMALSTGAGAEVQRPLATVVIGGLVTSTLLTLLVVPAVYAWFAGRRAEVEV